MFDTYQSIKELKKEGKFTEQQAASIVKIISSSAEQGLADLATKQDIELLKAEMNANMAQMYVNIIKWFIGIFITMGGTLITAMYYMLKHMPAMQQVIQTH